MCKNTPKRSQPGPSISNGKPSNASPASSSSMGMIVNFVTAAYTCGFVSFRVMEIASLIAGFPTQVLTSLVACCIVLNKATKVPGSLIVILTMAAFVWITDDYILDPVVIPSLSSSSQQQQAMVVVVTGANSGVGFETAKALASTGILTVIMGCRSVSKCEAAAETIRKSQRQSTAAHSSSSGGGGNHNVIPLPLDLSNFDSVFKFVDLVQERLPQRNVNVLFNNAGYVPVAVESANAYGLDPSFTSMHLSHFLLAELLVKRNPELRLVATSSGTHHTCAAPAVLPKIVNDLFLTNPPSCIDHDYLTNRMYSAVNEDKYIVAKVANVLHVSEFSKRHPQSTALAIDLGWVGTSIQPWMSGQITPTSLGWMRSASVGIYPILQAILLEQPAKDRDWSTQGGVTMDPLGNLREPFSFPLWRGDASPEVMKQVGRELWKKSTEILQQHGCTVCQ
ncbi:MAG: hypothetical protein SGBAC_013070 [Bacillariaceae sp.]